MKKRKYNTTKTLFKLRTDLKCLFKAYCAERGKTMTEVLEEMIREKLKKK